MCNILCPVMFPIKFHFKGLPLQLKCAFPNDYTHVVQSELFIVFEIGAFVLLWQECCYTPFVFFLPKHVP